MRVYARRENILTTKFTRIAFFFCLIFYFIFFCISKLKLCLFSSKQFDRVLLNYKNTQVYIVVPNWKKLTYGPFYFLVLAPITKALIINEHCLKIETPFFFLAYTNLQHSIPLDLQQFPFFQRGWSGHEEYLDTNAISTIQAMQGGGSGVVDFFGQLL